VQAAAPPQLAGWEPATFEAGQDAPVRGIVSEQDAHLVALQARGEKVRRRVKILILFPEVADVITRRRECVGDAERDAALDWRSVVKTLGSEQAEEPGFLSAVALSFTLPELSERTHHGFHLSHVRATSGARPQVFVAASTLDRG
jgi:hypothetical protein